MKRPWQIWLLFLLCLVIVVPAMGWLTLKALELDRAESLARRQAELEEDASRALWRMDARLTPLLAQEAARPYFVYRSFYSAPDENGTKGGPPSAASPLLTQPSPYVLLHFQVHPDDQLTSPQCPTGVQNTWALDRGAAQENIDASAQRLSQLQGQIHHSQLLGQLPEDMLPPIEVGQTVWSANAAQLADSNPSIVKNTVDIDKLQQQISSPQPEVSQQAAAPQQQALYGPGNYDSGRFQRSQSRLGNDLQNRDAAYQAFAQKEVVEQRLNLPTALPLKLVSEGISQPMWVGPNLLLARRVKIGDEVLVQGCWLDWPKIKQLLVDEVADLLPQMDLVPVTNENQIKVSRLLATLPVQLVVPNPVPQPAPFSPIRISLMVAWGCLLLATLAVAALLQGVVTLSERRGAFVSAVTHELRTPLTTFRMYAEMLAEGMVPDSQQRQHYLETLRIEADRLWHLVENVLAYARLERGPHGQRREKLSLAKLIDRVESRLQDRAAQADMQLVVEADEHARYTTLDTDPAAVEQILFNLVDNACKYAATADDRRIHLKLEHCRGGISFRVSDHGPGINGPQARRLFRPFSKSVHEAANSAPGVGLGLALSRRLALALGGRLELESSRQVGAMFVLVLPCGDGISRARA
jgi:signal transduction histidine kinase